LADIKWIKITTDIFDDEKMLMIETMPSADSIIVIWFKLLTFAGKQNNDGVFLMSNRIAYTDEMLAAIFRRDINVIRLALNAFEKFGMIEIVENVITIPNWNKHQSLDAYEKKKERDRLYQAERRANQRALIEKSSDKSSDCQTTQSSYVVVSDKEEEKESDREKELYSSIVSYLNEKAGTKYKATTAKTKTAIHARLSDGFALDDFKMVIDKKCAEWIGTEFEKYLRPETLFGTKFESYLNAKVTNGRNGNNGGLASNHVPNTAKIGNYI
jgi:predicted phage replisome organizer/uncharacterized phage protein (TIGR02220 family)